MLPEAARDEARERQDDEGRFSGLPRPLQPAGETPGGSLGTGKDAGERADPHKDGQDRHGADLARPAGQDVRARKIEAGQDHAHIAPPRQGQTRAGLPRRGIGARARREGREPERERHQEKDVPDNDLERAQEAACPARPRPPDMAPAGLPEDSVLKRAKRAVHFGEAIGGKIRVAGHEGQCGTGEGRVG